MKSPQFVALAALAIFAMAACGGSSTASTGETTTAAPTGETTTAAPTGETTTTAAPTTGAVDQCALLSPADLKTVTGDDYGAGVLNSVGSCDWVVGAGQKIVTAFTHTLSLSTFKSNNPGGVDVTVSGHAGYRISDQGTERIWVDVDGRTLVLWFYPVGPDSQANAQILAEIAIGNM